MGCSRRHATLTSPAQTQSSSPRQAEFVVCDKTIERTFAWLNRFRRLTIRYERLADLHLAFLDLGCALICLRFLQHGF
jgi:transposase